MNMKIERVSVVDQTIERLKEYINEEGLQQGDRMPTEQEVCRMYGIGRSTVREAYRMMQALGIIESLRGKGVYLTSQTARVRESDIADWFRINSENIENCMEVRSAIEIMSVKLAMRQTDKSWTKRLRLISDRVRDDLLIKKNQQNRGVIMSLYDEEFHREITAVSNNSLLICIENSIANCLIDYRNRIFMLEENIVKAYESHCRIIEALEGSDEQYAIEKLTEHMDSTLLDMKSI